MAYKYTHFISQNIAPRGAKSIDVYDGDGEKVCAIPLGRLAPPMAGKLYSFGLVSDMHLYKAEPSWLANTKYEAALAHFLSKNCVFCAHAGDSTQTGFYNEGDTTTFAPEQFEKYKTICGKYPTLPVYGICGNHESYEVEIASNLAELKDYTGTDLYYTVAQGDDLFVFVGQATETHPMSDEELQWLYEILEENRNKRCFVFVHSYMEGDSGDPMDKRENSIFEMWETAKTSVFIDIMRHYKNAVLLHGHSHTKFECQEFDEKANYTEVNGFKSVHIPSLGRPRNLDLESTSQSTPYADAESQGYIVDVYDDCIVLNGWDFVNNLPVPLGTYKIDTPLQTIPAGTFVDSTGTIKTQ